MIDALQRVRELLLQKGNSVFAKEDLDTIDSEIASQYDQVLFLLRSAEFNKIRVFGTLFEDSQFKGIFMNTSYFSLANVDAMLGFLVSQRSYYGAKANQIEHRIKSRMTGRENYEGFQSTILDIDYGVETSMLLRNQVLILANILLLEMR
jgi:flagellin-like hook-associated protein FlgL